MKSIKHLPLEIDPSKNRFHYYETLWKIEALKLLQKHCPTVQGMSLLDYGCGRGETMKMAADLQMIPAGTDTDPECVKLSSKFGKSVILNIEDPISQFGKDSYDVVSCFHVLEHVSCPLGVAKILRNIARKYVLIAVPNLSAFHDLLRPSKWDVPINEGHLQSWDHAHLRNLLERHAGLKIVDWGFDCVIIPPISNLLFHFLGKNITIFFETKIFKRFFPFASNSVIALTKKI